MDCAAPQHPGAVKTLFWSGSLCASVFHGQAAVWRWWNYYRQHSGALGITHWGVFNDGPLNLPVEFFVDKQEGSGPLRPFAQNKLNLVYHNEHLGRASVHQIPGFWRNLLMAVKVCREQDFDRFVLVEYDCLILSAEMLYEVGATTTGLTCYWCPTYSIPETSVVICGKDRFQRTEEQAQAIFNKTSAGSEDRFETAMDWTEVRKHRKGDRYPETTRAVPADADYVCQLPIHAHLAWGRVIEVLE